MSRYGIGGVSIVHIKKPFKLPCSKLECWELKDVSDGSPLEQLAAMAEEDFDPEVWNFHCLEHGTTFHVGDVCNGGDIQLTADCIVPVSAQVAATMVKHDMAQLTSWQAIIASLIKNKTQVVLDD